MVIEMTVYRTYGKTAENTVCRIWILEPYQYTTLDPLATWSGEAIVMLEQSREEKLSEMEGQMLQNV
jgi:hypothetical protein